MDTLGYIKAACDADYRATASEQERIVFYELTDTAYADYEKYCKRRTKSEKITTQG